MNSFGWALAVIFTLGITFAVGGIVALLLAIAKRDRAHKRDMRKLLATLPAEERGRFAIMQDLKDLNS
jgi:hypothetical protein